MVYVGWGLCICKTGERIHLVYTSFEVLSSLMEISYKDYKSYKDIYENTDKIRICQIM